MNYDLEKYRDSLPDFDSSNQFLDIREVSINELSNYTNHKLWIRYKYDDGMTEDIDTLISIDKRQNMIYFKNNADMNYTDLIGIEDLNNNYNEGNIDFNLFIDKKVRIINRYDNSIDCAIQDVDDEFIWFAVRLENYSTLSYDLSYPINLIKKIVML